MRFPLIMLLLPIAAAGCGTKAPDVAAVKQHVSSDQRALGDPIVNSVGMVLVPILAGEFQMGTAVKDAALGARGQAEKQKAGPESPQHSVTITKPFFISSCEVTQQQYEQVMGASPWEGKPLVKEKAACAASYVSWDDAVEFCRKLSEQENQQYHLPTEAEWEYACRAGATTTWSFGDDGSLLNNYGWYGANAYHDSEQYPHSVGQKLPNAWGLYDMHGNVWEWCQDWYAPYNTKKKETVDPKGPEKGKYRVWRGGSFSRRVANNRSPTRPGDGPEDQRPGFAPGFRFVREVPARG